MSKQGELLAHGSESFHHLTFVYYLPLSTTPLYSYHPVLTFMILYHSPAQLWVKSCVFLCLHVCGYQHSFVISLWKFSGDTDKSHLRILSSIQSLFFLLVTASRNANNFANKFQHVVDVANPVFIFGNCHVIVMHACMNLHWSFILGLRTHL